MMYELRDFGFSTCVGIGGDPVIGTTHIDALDAFEADPETDAIVMIGEIGGDAEERAAAHIEEHITKPVVGYVAGFTAPEGKTMGHAGAIVSGSSGTAQAKKEALEKAGVRVGKTPSETARLMREIMKALLADAYGGRALAVIAGHEFRTPELVVSGAGAAMLINSILPWYGYDARGWHPTYIEFQSGFLGFHAAADRRAHRGHRRDLHLVGRHASAARRRPGQLERGLPGGRRRRGPADLLFWSTIPPSRGSPLGPSSASSSGLLSC